MTVFFSNCWITGDFVHVFVGYSRVTVFISLLVVHKWLSSCFCWLFTSACVRVCVGFSQVTVFISLLLIRNWQCSYFGWWCTVDGFKDTLRTRHGITYDGSLKRDSDTNNYRITELSTTMQDLYKCSNAWSKKPCTFIFMNVINTFPNYVQYSFQSHTDNTILKRFQVQKWN